MTELYEIVVPCKESIQLSDLYNLLHQQIQGIVYSVKITKLGSVQFFNNQTGPLLGFNPQEFMDNQYLWFSIIHPDDLYKVKMTTQAMLETGKPVTRTYRIRHKITGEYFLIEDKVSPQYDDTGNVIGYIGAVQDITDRKQDEYALQASEVRYRRLFEKAQDGILILDAETGQITDVNPFLVEMVGFTREALLGKKLWEIGPFKDVAASKAAFTALQEHGYIRYEDLPLETIDGRKIQVEFVSNVYKVDQSKVVQCNIRDITKRKQAEADREKLIRELEEALAKVKTLSGMLPICASCKKIRNDEGYWSQIEAYISEHSEVSFSHGICPECARKLYPDFFKKGDKDFP